MDRVVSQTRKKRPKRKTAPHCKVARKRKPGRYLLWCSLAGHDADGMATTVRVE